jgi:hypothetical protein
MTSYCFKGQAFGLQFCGNRPLPELSCSQEADVEIPDTILEWLDVEPPNGMGSPEAASFHFSGDTFALQVPGVARYQVTTDRITIKPQPDADDRSVRAFLFGSAIGALLQLRGLMVLHGSAVAMSDGEAAVFCGHSTAGKSTLAAALAAQGYPALADDVSAVRFDADGSAWCLPGLARTKLWRDALETLGLASRTSALTRVMPEMDKHAIHLTTSAKPARLRRFYELQTADGGGLTFSQATGMDKLNLLLNHAYRPAYLQLMGCQPTLLRQAGLLAPQILASRIVRPRGEATLDSIVQRLQQQWMSSPGLP